MNSRSAANEMNANSSDHAGPAEQEREADHEHHHPPRLDARVEVVDRRVRLALGAAALQHEADDRRDDEHHADAGEQRDGLLGARSLLPARRSASSALRARSTNASLSSPARQHDRRADRQRAQQRHGKSLPLGITRRAFSIHTGTNSTSGHALRQVIDAALERQQRLLGGIARAFGKHDQRVAVLDRRRPSARSGLRVRVSGLRSISTARITCSAT